MSNYRRRTAITQSGKDGWNMSDGDVVYIQPRGAGGGKRARVSGGASKMDYDEKLRELQEEMAMAHMRIQSAPLPFALELSNSFMTFKDNLMASPEKALDDYFKSFDKETLKKMQSLMSITNTDNKVMNIAKVVFKTEHTKILEVQRQMFACEQSMKALVHIMLMKNFASDEDASIQWMVLSKKLLDMIGSSADVNDTML